VLLNIHHQTLCQYPRPVSYSIQHLRLTPRSEPSQRALSWSIAAPGRRRQLTDAHGNVSHLLTLDQPHREISIVVDGVVETLDQGGYLLHDPGMVSPLAYLGETSLTQADATMRALARERLHPGREQLRALLDFLPELCERVAQQPAAGDAFGSAADALRLGHGPCQDHAHAFIACCRAAGIPARFVSGYYYVGAGDEGCAGGEAASYAWADAWVDRLGWVSFDITHQRLAGPEHCRLAVGRDYLDACPVRGVQRGGVTEELRVSAQGLKRQE
jgi:transglutaminase-like putative cysteine protease